MASKNNAVENFEEWRKNKNTPSEPEAQDAPDVETPVVEKPAAEPTSSALSALTSFFTQAAKSLASLMKSGVARIKLAFAPQGNKGVAPAGDKAEKGLSLSKIPGSIRAKFSEATPRVKKITLASVIAGAIVIITIVLLAKFEFVTPNGGIKTSAGSAQGTTVLIEKGAAIAPNDLIVAVQPGSPEDAPELIIGTVFSSNEETYALYDGEVIWQIPVGDLKGKVLFAEATQKLP